MQRDLEQLRAVFYINQLTVKEDKTIVTLSVPRCFYMNNSYYVKTQFEINEALKYLDNKFHDFDYTVLEIDILLLEYPFDIQRAEGEDFRSHTQMFELLKNAVNVEGKVRAEKNIGLEVDKYRFKEKASSQFNNTTIKIYDQLRKFINQYEDEPEKLQKTLEDNPTLVNTTRIEARFRYRRKLKSTKGIDLKDVKQKALENIEKYCLNQSLIDEELENTLEILTENYLSDNKNMNKFITKNKDIIYDFTLIKQMFEKLFGKTAKTRNYTCRAKRFVQTLEEETGIFYIGNLKRLKDYKKQIVKQVKEVVKYERKL